MVLPKPKFGSPCNGCGYCCTVQPCMLAREMLNCTEGPCVALESQGDRHVCGLVRNPLAYLYKANNPGADVPLLDPAPASEAAGRLSAEIASALGLGMGCDAEDGLPSHAAWEAGLTGDRQLSPGHAGSASGG